jgi:sugar transferase EpsL
MKNLLKVNVSLKIKRVIDFSAGVVGIILFGIIISITSIVILFSMGKPIFFVQVRPGLNEKLFKLWKFRTMKNPGCGEEWLFSDGERITPIGKFLRKYSIDELPQLWNLLKGDMSLVGPRPLLKEYLSVYTKRQRHRHDVKPGITGWAQINGRNNLTLSERRELDIWYVENWSITLDLRIICKTIGQVLTGKNVKVVSKMSLVDDQGFANALNEKKWSKTNDN